MKRFFIIAAATVLALVGFSCFSQGKDAAGEEEEAGTDFQNIPLTARQVKTAGIGFGKAKERDIDETLSVNGHIVLRAKAKLQGIAQQLAQLGIPATGASKGRFVTTFPVKAPISGTVSNITASPGSYADMQTPLMSIRDNAAVECD